MNKNRKAAIEKLGGIICRGLSFIGGENCPVPADKLTITDLNLGHKRSVGRKKREDSRILAARILRMKNPHKNFILLCTLCNQRMRHLAGEWRYVHIPKRAINLYKEGKSLLQLALIFDCHYATVARFLRKHRCEIRKAGVEGGRQVWKTQRAKLTKERRIRHSSIQRMLLAREAMSMYDDGDSMREIGEWLGISKNSVLALLRLNQV